MKQMNKIVKNLVSSSAILLILSGCSNETPFNVEGDGVLKMHTEYRGDYNIVTRASISGYEDDYLDRNLVVYIENAKGVIRKYIRKDQIPEAISLPVGNYVVEGWTGDSVSASWDKKFFRGYQSNIIIGEGVKDITLNLDIANVLVSVDKSVLDEEISDLKIKFYHSRGEIVFSNSEIEGDKVGYFMMPNADKNLNYIIEGKNKIGKGFTKSGEIVDVKRAHRYNIKLSSEQEENKTGGALIKLVIEDIPVIEQRYEILPPPSFKAIYGQDEWDIERQITSTSKVKDFKDLKVRVLAYNSLESLKIKFDDRMSILSDISEIELISDDTNSKLESHGMSLEINKNEKERSSETNSITVIEAWLTFPASIFNELSEQDKEYLIEISAKDDRNYQNKAILRIANTDGALVDPILSSETPNKETSPMAILGTSAELTITLLDNSKEDFGIMYKEVGEEIFKKISAKTNGKLLGTRTSTNSIYCIRLDNLKVGTTYEYKSYCDNFEENSVKKFTTEEKYIIPNSDMSSWSTDTSGKKDGAIFPGVGTAPTYWDSGNHGSITMKINLTQSDNNFIPGNTVARLRSQFVGLVGTLGKFAAGNIFTGEFFGVDGTDGILHLGRAYNNSHPSSLNVKVNYRPQTVESRSAKAPYKKTGDLDEAQIYVALITGDYYEVKTKNQSKLFDENDSQVLAYGQVTYSENIGNDNELVIQNIPLKYKESAKTLMPNRLIIVCAASKYGDYFTGGEGSILYVDDFELEYGDIQWAE